MVGLAGAVGAGSEAGVFGVGEFGAGLLGVGVLVGGGDKSRWGISVVGWMIGFCGSGESTGVSVS